MPDIQSTIRTLTLADGTVSGLVGTRMYSDVLPQSPTLPAIVSIVIATEAHEHLSGIANIAQATIQVDSYAETRTAANSLADAVRLALEKQGRGDNSGQFINEINLISGERHGVDAPQDGSARFRYITILDFLVSYRTTTS